MLHIPLVALVYILRVFYIHYAQRISLCLLLYILFPNMFPLSLLLLFQLVWSSNILWQW